MLVSKSPPLFQPSNDAAERRYIEVTREELGPEDAAPVRVDVRPPRKVYPVLGSEESLAEVSALRK